MGTIQIGRAKRPAQNEVHFVLHEVHPGERRVDDILDRSHIQNYLHTMDSTTMLHYQVYSMFQFPHKDYYNTDDLAKSKRNQSFSFQQIDRLLQKDFWVLLESTYA